jgi:Domain of unknown function (DUF4166)
VPSSRTSAASPYEAVLGAAFSRLHPHVQTAHSAPLVARGTLRVEHGDHLLAPLLIKLLKLPPAGEGQPAALTVTSNGRCLNWIRQIGPVMLRTEQHARRGRIIEDSGLGRVIFTLDVEDGALLYRQVSMSAARLRLPAFICPQVQARVSSAPRGWHVDVLVTWQAELVCRYSGMMRVA